MGRSYSSGVAVDEPNFGPDVAVRVAPVPQHNAARARSPRAHVHVSAQVDAHLRVLGFWPRRWRGGAVLVFRRTAAASAQSFPRIRLPCALALVSAPLWLGRRRRCPNHCAELRKRSLRPRAACQVCSMASFGLRFCLCCWECRDWQNETGPPTPLTPLWRTPGDGLESFRRCPKNSRVLHSVASSIAKIATESAITRGLPIFEAK